MNRFWRILVLITFCSSVFHALPVFSADNPTSLTINKYPARQTDFGTGVFLKGIKVDPKNPLNFNFIVNNGGRSLSRQQVELEAQRVIHYFFAGLTIPARDLWVNLSPYEKNRVIPDLLAATELGEDMLKQDYLLKQFTAMVFNPKQSLGRDFWDNVRKNILEKYGVVNVPVDICNKVWIVPGTAQIYVNGQAAYIVKSSLKVMLDQDRMGVAQDRSGEVSVKIAREMIVPAIEKEINQGKDFTVIRQIYDALILAQWYKKNFEQNTFKKAYSDKNKVFGIDLADKKSKDQVYHEYTNAFHNGAFDFIQSDYDRARRRVVYTKYFSGGELFSDIKLEEKRGVDPGDLPKPGEDYAIHVYANPQIATGSDDAGGDTFTRLLRDFFGNDKAALMRRLEQLRQDYRDILRKDISLEDLLKKEFLRITDENGLYTGDVTTRELSHSSKKVWHRTVGCFLIDRQGRVLFQKRALNKTVRPGAYDVSAGGHVGLDDSAIGMLREIEEEVFDGKYSVDPQRLSRITPNGQFIKNFENAENATFFIYNLGDEEKNMISHQEEEISGVEWLDMNSISALLRRYEAYRQLPEAVRVVIDKLKKGVELTQAEKQVKAEYGLLDDPESFAVGFCFFDYALGQDNFKKQVTSATAQSIFAANYKIANGRPRDILVVMDKDGTLTLPNQPIDNAVVQKIVGLLAKNVRLSVLTGGALFNSDTNVIKPIEEEAMRQGVSLENFTYYLANGAQKLCWTADGTRLPAEFIDDHISGAEAVEVARAMALLCIDKLEQLEELKLKGIAQLRSAIGQASEAKQVMQLFNDFIKNNPVLGDVEMVMYDGGIADKSTLKIYIEMADSVGKKVNSLMHSSRVGLYVQEGIKDLVAKMNVGRKGKLVVSAGTTFVDIGVLDKDIAFERIVEEMSSDDPLVVAIGDGTNDHSFLNARLRQPYGDKISFFVGDEVEGLSDSVAVTPAKGPKSTFLILEALWSVIAGSQGSAVGGIDMMNIAVDEGGVLRGAVPMGNACQAFDNHRLIGITPVTLRALPIEDLMLFMKTRE